MLVQENVKNQSLFQIVDRFLVVLILLILYHFKHVVLKKYLKGELVNPLQLKNYLYYLIIYRSLT